MCITAIRIILGTVMRKADCLHNLWVKEAGKHKMSGIYGRRNKRAGHPNRKEIWYCKSIPFWFICQGDYHENSDIDLRIEKGRLKGLFALGGFYEEVKPALETDVDVLTTGGLEAGFLEKIKADEVLLCAECENSWI